MQVCYCCWLSSQRKLSLSNLNIWWWSRQHVHTKRKLLHTRALSRRFQTQHSRVEKVNASDSDLDDTHIYFSFFGRSAVSFNFFFFRFYSPHSSFLLFFSSDSIFISSDPFSGSLCSDAYAAHSNNRQHSTRQRDEMKLHTICCTQRWSGGILLLKSAANKNLQLHSTAPNTTRHSTRCCMYFKCKSSAPELPRESSTATVFQLLTSASTSTCTFSSQTLFLHFLEQISTCLAWLFSTRTGGKALLTRLEE